MPTDNQDAQDERPSSPGRGRTSTTSEAGPSNQAPLREGSSMSRGRTRRIEVEYTEPPRDPDGYNTSSPEDYVYEDGLGGYAPRKPDSASSSAPGHYQTRMLSEPQMTLPGAEFLRHRDQEARARAAEASREEREYHRQQASMQAREPGRRRKPDPHYHPARSRTSTTQRSNEDWGCCVVL
ncbi:hypothetical protein M406DRAFT_66511 [Cryphonectria parasitica EP155]|uniref:Uncharacterized protein n=1 Tax=Cryphonectria parasitica (strain ATCC 38755 / EP155) TaxID=660469 RepID=A0A9P4YBM7_CRYP1|nr:uncharacterized protein M406DRAFT_66511 [Cryphonectria parasitica EP155]KAF3770065.1 hypothetical protein M406DRAFT_66511 [Cryphonectria parasitica EP155]